MTIVLDSIGMATYSFQGIEYYGADRMIRDIITNLQTKAKKRSGSPNPDRESYQYSGSGTSNKLASRNFYRAIFPANCRRR